MYDFKKYGLTEPLIHIGFPKALFTWMQSNLFRAENGLLQLMRPVEVQPVIVDPAPFNFKPKEIYAILDKKIAEHKELESMVPVITSEALSGNLFCVGFNARDMSDRLSDAFPDARVMIVIREQKSMIRALYNTQIKWGFPHSIERMLNPIVPSMCPQFRHDYLRYDGIIDYYKKKFGKEHVLVLPFELFLETPREFINSIYEFSGAMKTWGHRIVRLPYDTKSNPSAPLAYLKLLRIYNLLFISNNFNQLALFRENNKRLYRRIMKIEKRERFIPGFTKNWFEKGMKTYIAEQAYGKYSESNRKVTEMTGIDLAKYGYDV